MTTDRHREYANGDGWSLMQGDCMEVMPTLQPFSAKVVLTDPPYMIGASSVGRNTAGQSWADLMNAAYWYSSWMEKALRLTRTDGFLATFCNWRSIPMYMRALFMLGKAWSNCLIWDKDWIGPGPQSAFRPTWEAVLIYARPDAIVEDRSAPDLYTCKWHTTHKGTTGHRAEKPEELLQWLISKLSREDDLIIDCFAGSGSTMQAALKTGRKAIGIEVENKWCHVTAERLGNLQRQGELFQRS